MLLPEVVQGADLYTGLTPAEVEKVKRATREIHTAGRIAKRSMIAIGLRLAEIKPILTKNGMWRRWLAEEFDASHDTADRYIAVATRFGSVDAIASFDKAALYILSAEDVPAEARDMAIELAEQGTHITRQVAEEIAATFQKAATAVVAEAVLTKGHISVNGQSLGLSARQFVEELQEDGTTIDRPIELTPESLNVIGAAVSAQAVDLINSNRDRVIDHIVRRSERLGRIELLKALTVEEFFDQSTDLLEMIDAARLDGASIQLEFTVWGIIQ